MNLVPPKTCTWSCIYCYLGFSYPTVTRRKFIDTKEVVENVCKAVRKYRPDYVTLIGVGEPTLAANIGEVIEEVKKRTSTPIAVFSNGSLFNNMDVLVEILDADYVKATLTSTDENVWRLIHNPAAPANIEEHIEGLVEASKLLRKGLHIEVMLVKGVNDDIENAIGIAYALRNVRIASISINAPTRPPASKWVEPPTPSTLLKFANILSRILTDTPIEITCLKPSRPPRIDPTRPLESLVEITSGHILEINEAKQALEEAGVAAEEIIKRALDEGYLEIVEVAGRRYLRALSTPAQR